MIKKGQLILVSSGEYSSYGILAITTAAKDFDPKEIIPTFKSEVKPRWKNSWEEYAFGDWLIERGFLVKIPWRELYLGDYGSLNVSLGEEKETTPND